MTYISNNIIMNFELRYISRGKNDVDISDLDEQFDFVVTPYPRPQIEYFRMPVELFQDRKCGCTNFFAPRCRNMLHCYSSRLVQVYLTRVGYDHFANLFIYPTDDQIIRIASDIDNSYQTTLRYDSSLLAILCDCLDDVRHHIVPQDNVTVLQKFLGIISYLEDCVSDIFQKNYYGDSLVSNQTGSYRGEDLENLWLNFFPHFIRQATEMNTQVDYYVEGYYGIVEFDPLQIYQNWSVGDKFKNHLHLHYSKKGMKLAPGKGYNVYVLDKCNKNQSSVIDEIATIDVTLDKVFSEYESHLLVPDHIHDSQENYDQEIVTMDIDAFVSHDISFAVAYIEDLFSRYPLLNVLLILDWYLFTVAITPINMKTLSSCVVDGVVQFGEWCKDNDGWKYFVHLPDRIDTLLTYLIVCSQTCRDRNYSSFTLEIYDICALDSVDLALLFRMLEFNSSYNDGHFEVSTDFEMFERKPVRCFNFKRLFASCFVWWMLFSRKSPRRVTYNEIFAHYDTFPKAYVMSIISGLYQMGVVRYDVDSRNIYFCNVFVAIKFIISAPTVKYHRFDLQMNHISSPTVRLFRNINQLGYRNYSRHFPHSIISQTSQRLVKDVFQIYEMFYSCKTHANAHFRLILSLLQIKHFKFDSRTREFIINNLKLFGVPCDVMILEFIRIAGTIGTIEFVPKQIPLSTVQWSDYKVKSSESLFKGMYAYEVV